MIDLKAICRLRLQEIQHAGLYRRPLRIDSATGPVVQFQGRAVINLASNDYLGLANHPALRTAAQKSLSVWGVGAGAARLVTGTLALHQELENLLAQTLKCEAAILFGSGYLCHLGTLPALCEAADVIYSDELNHASIVDACRLSRATVKVYRHNDVQHLHELLSHDGPSFRCRLIISETLFSMDGDTAPLDELCALAEKHRAWVIVDEAHAFGLHGHRGAGFAAMEHTASRPVIMGTLGKAVGCYGAFVAGPHELVDLLTNRARTYIYSTALPPAVVASALEAINLIQNAEGERLRNRLFQNCETLKNGLVAQGWAIVPVKGPIFPLMVGDPKRALSLADRLLELGVLVRAMRYPTVPRGTERLRLVVSAAHSELQLQQILSAFKQVSQEKI